VKIGLASATCVALALPAFVVATSTTAHADGETCDGKPATIVIAEPPSSSTPVTGTDGDDVIVVTYPGPVTFLVEGGPGEDTICGGGSTIVYGGNGNDDLWSGAVPSGKALDDFMRGGNGNDVLHGDQAGEYLSGDDGDDTIYGNGGNDVIYGDNGDIQTVPASADDTIDAGTGADTVVDDWGDDILVGGPGRDALVLGDGPVVPYDDCFWSGDIAATLDARAGTVSGLGDDTFSGFRVYQAGSFRNTMLGSDGSDWFETGVCASSATIEGRGGDDHIFEYAGTGSVTGGSGDDRILVAASDPVHAGRGADRVEVNQTQSDAPVGVELEGGPGRDRLVEASGRFDRIDLRHGLAVNGIWRVTVQAFEDAIALRPQRGAETRSFVLVGTSGRNLLRVARAAPETSPPAIIRGLGGNDTLLGRHCDTADGGPGRDLCRAGHEISCARS
jgi:Ca2+-binding RTX toxin-like protein